ncbi:Similar to EIF3K: Eukaryotic translation initiation factor 3 subunit K (Homo sapiens) [Cotesia congregata]|uniref:Similar to EIF3K: Eukaryotic translation initiation factor 3 subunit K (Homo sapiens) n=1 Tax=Cotesia congregata TaxID=51543 RepID=A0A8J2HJV4_COTCN|nr:Similar to EIF3K: Eukaryotic translation initiation factor 3 subunit K (Homo sapiens) [Cotesia congregata]
MVEAMRQSIADMIKGIERYNPVHLPTLEQYVDVQTRENAYDLEANLTVLKLYQLNPQSFKNDVTAQILLKALTNLPHTDFVLCKCLLSEKIHWVKKYGWQEQSKNVIFIANQDENIKTKNITEKIDFENVAGLMAACL